MSRLIYFTMIVLMIVWSAAVVADLAQVVLASKAVAGAAADGSPVNVAQGAVGELWADFWGPKAQARAIIWGIPMIAFAMVAAISQR